MLKKRFGIDSKVGKVYLALSRGGKEILIKSVVQSIPSYVASVFFLPKKYVKKLKV